MTVSSTDGAGKTGQLHLKEWNWITPYTKVNPKWIKDLNVSHETIKLLEKNIGKNLLDINMSDLFLNIISLGKENNSKNEQVGLY